VSFPSPPAEVNAIHPRQVKHRFLHIRSVTIRGTEGIMGYEIYLAPHRVPASLLPPRRSRGSAARRTRGRGSSRACPLPWSGGPLALGGSCPRRTRLCPLQRRHCQSAASSAPGMAGVGVFVPTNMCLIPFIHEIKRYLAHLVSSNSKQLEVPFSYRIFESGSESCDTSSCLAGLQVI